MATHMQLKVLFGRKSHGRPDFLKKNNYKVVSFSALFFMSTIKWITEKELERVIENKGDEFRRDKNMEIQSRNASGQQGAANKVKMSGGEK